jgi:hypothetical protein
MIAYYSLWQPPPAKRIKGAAVLIKPFPLLVQAMKETVIPKEKAVFWLDCNGYWRNRHGRFERPSIIARFHASIGRDQEGYYLSQVNGDVREKVYFHHEDTALFVFNLRTTGQETDLILNTGREIPLVPESLFITGDALYTVFEGERIRFAERVLVKMSRLLEDDGETCYLRLGDMRVPIPEVASPAETTI